jgi:hypothetical protein
MNAKSQAQISGKDDALANVARTIGTALGTIAGKISPTPKPTRRRKKPLKTRVAKRAKAISANAKKVRSKRRT